MPTLDVEEELHREQCSFFRGSARIRLVHLEPDPGDSFTFDEKNVARLQDVFKLQGCLRLKADHHVPAVISNEVFEAALLASGLQRQDLYLPDTLQALTFGEGFHLRVLHGRHRLRAAERFCLLDEDRWWTIDLYDDKLPQNLVQSIREDYSNSRNFCDGDIYRQLRHHQTNGHHDEAGTWLARLTAGKRKDIKQLQAKVKSLGTVEQSQEERNPLSNALDGLLPIIGLWSCFPIGTLHRILTMRCTPENTNYVKNVDRIWTYILGDKNEFGCLADALTVKRLEMRTPKLSTDDADEVRKLMDDGLLFPQIPDSAMRASILTRLENLSEPVLTLHTFIDDTKLLELGARPLRLLLPPDWRGPLRESFKRIHTTSESSPHINIQRSEYEFVTRDCPRDLGFTFVYPQLFLYTTRNFASLTGVAPRKECGKPKPTVSTTTDGSSLWRLADLAYRLGFRSEQIRALRDKHPDTQMARGFLRQLRPAECFEFTSTDREVLVQAICHRLAEVSRSSVMVESPVYTTDLQKQPLQHRSGRPYDDGYRIDRKHLFIENIYGRYEPRRARYLTSFALKRYTFIAFFGSFDIETNLPPGPPPDPPPDPPLGPDPGPVPVPASVPALDLSGDSSQTATNSGAAQGSEGMPGVIFHKLGPNQTATSLIALHLAASASDTRTLFYLWEERSYAYFGDNDQADCERFAQDLANRQHFFVVLTSPTRTSSPAVTHMWSSARNFRIIMAGPQKRRAIPGGKRLARFLEYIEAKPILLG